MDEGLVVRDVSKSFAHEAGSVSVLQQCNLTLKAGSCLAIQGPSGSGKSSLLHILGTLDQPSSGSVLIGGTNPFELDNKALAVFRNATIGFVFQDHHLLPQYSVLENVLLPTLVQTSDDAHEQHARALLDRVGLSHRLDHRPAELSGGERQRAAIARALVNRPALLLCDEPTGNLDRKTATSVTDLLFELHHEHNNMMIAVTHSEHLASRFNDVAELLDGTLCLLGEKAH